MYMYMYIYIYIYIYIYSRFSHYTLKSFHSIIECALFICWPYARLSKLSKIKILVSK